MQAPNNLNRKGGMERSLMVLFSLVLTVFLIYMFVNLGTSGAKEENFLLHYYANDFALLVESMQALPGDVQINYPLQDGFSLQLGEGFVEVEHERIALPVRESFHLLPRTRIVPQKVTGAITLTKIADVISFDAPNLALLEGCGQNLDLFPLDISVEQKTSSKTGTLSSSELDLIQESFESALSQDTQDGVQDLPSKNNLRLYLTSEQMTKQDPEKNEESNKEEEVGSQVEIILQQPTAQEEKEINYDWLICRLGRELKNYHAQSITNGEDGEGYTLTINMNPEKPEAFLTQRSDFVTRILEVLQ